MIWKGVEICCPWCKGDLKEGTRDSELNCRSCGRCFPVLLGIPDLRTFSDPYIEAEADRAKGLLVATRIDELGFSELVDFYYSITCVVPPSHAALYKRGLMSGVARSEAAFANWESMSRTNGQAGTGSLLEIGCGTAPLLVAAAGRFTTLVGVDIAFRWLIVAKKRLAEAGLDIPLICACAEALPFPAGTFDKVAADSTLEHLQDQRAALAECNRVMRPSGRLLVSTPNRYSLGPDPQAGIWAGGLLPQRWVASYVRKQGGIPPKRRLLSAESLRSLIKAAGFTSPKVSLPNIPAGQREYFGKGINLLIDLYHTAKQVPVSREILRWVGPHLSAVAEKPVQSSFK